MAGARGMDVEFESKVPSVTLYDRTLLIPSDGIVISTPEPDKITHAIIDIERYIALTIDCDFVSGVSLKAEMISSTTPVYATRPYTINSIRLISKLILISITF